MKRILVPLGLLPLLLIGVGAAVALTPGEHVACATATVPAQTIAANGTALGTIPGAGSVACTTATDQTVTVTNKVTTTVTPPPSGVIASEAAIFLGGSLPNQSNLGKYALVAVGADYSSAGLPGKTIKYVTGQECYDSDDVIASYATCKANGWLLHDCNGNEIRNTSSSSAVWTDPGNVSYQNDLKQRILNFLSLHPGLDGVYFDDFDMAQETGCFPIRDQSNHVLWNTQTDFQNAQISMISNVGAALKAAGYVVGVNAKGFISGDNNSNDGTLSKRWMDRYAPYVTATMQEFWNQRSDTHTVFLQGKDAWYHEWTGWESVIPYAYSKGIDPWPLTSQSASEEQQCRFFRGSFLLEWNGSSGFSMIDGWNASNLWNNCTAFDPGTPTGAKQEVYTTSCGVESCHVYRRDFTKGYVLVNPTWVSVTVAGETIPSGDAILHQN